MTTLVWDKEEWRDVVGFESGYMVSCFGEVYRKPYVKRARNKYSGFSYEVSGRYIKPCVDSSGYHWYTFYKEGEKKCLKIHRLVAEAFIGPAPSSLHQINHKDGNKINNCVDNLEWVTVKENIKHSYDIGLASNKGEKHPKSKFKDKDVLELISKREAGVSVKQLAKEYGVTISTIYKVTNKVNYKHVHNCI